LLISRIIHKSTVAEKWRQRAVSVLLDRVLRLISSDGYYREKSPAYAFLVFQYLTIALWCMKPTGKERCKIKSRRDALGKKLLRLRFETGRLPSLGDDDDARLLEFKPRHGRMHEHISFIDLISSAAIVGRQRADYVKGYEISMLRSGELEVSLNVDNLPIAKKVAPHIHDDILQVSLLCRGEPILIDPGTFSYSINPAKRDWYRGAISHNAPVISAKPTSEPWSHFRWNRIGRGASLGVKTSGQAVATSARRRDDAVRRHCVLWPGGMVLIDQIKTSLQLHTIKWLFHFGGGKIMTSPEGWSVANTTGDCEFRIGCSAAGDLNILGTKVVHCPWSPRYGVEKSGYGISASALNKDKGWMIWCFIRNRIHQQEIVLEPESRVQGRAVWRQEKETPLFSWQIRGGRFFLNIPGADSARFEWV
jgi:hypothetical protein